MRRYVWTLTAAVAAAIGAESAHADYIMTPLSGGASFLEVMPGESFDLDIMLTSDAADIHNSAIFRVVLSQPGLFYDSYSWSLPYETGSIFDDSSPFIDDLPVQLDDMTLSGAGYPADVVDFELSNVVPGSEVFGEGLFVSLDLTVPMDFSPGSVFIDLVPDTIANGFDEILTTAGPTFELIVLPAPGGVVVLVLAGIIDGRRRQRANLTRASRL